MPTGRRSLPGHWWLMIALVALAGGLGVTIAVAASLGSFSDSSAARGYRGVAATPTPSRTPRPTPTPTPLVPAAAVGQAGVAPRLYATDPRHLLLVGAAASFQSQDGGLTWTRLPATPGGASPPEVAGDATAGRLLVGGNGAWTSTDGGRTWASITVRPAVNGPFSALAANPGDPTVWFLAAQGHLLRTRDAGVSWRESLTGLPATLAEPVMRPAAAADTFLLAAGGHVYLLKDNGQQVGDLGATGASGTITDVAQVADADYAVRTSDGHVYVSAGGWHDAHAPVGGVLAVTKGRILVADGGAELGKPGAIQMTTSDGTAWTAAGGLPPDQSVEALAFAGDGTAFAYCYAGDLFSSGDGGQTWKFVSGALRAPAPSPSPSPSPTSR